MNKKDLTLMRKSVADKYHIPTMPNYAKRKPNQICISMANSWEHEQAKCKLCYDLGKEGKEFITETNTKDNERRVDVVCLDDGLEYEIETDPKRAARFDGMKGVIVIKTWVDREAKVINSTRL